MAKFISLLVAFVLLAFIATAQHTVESIPNQKLLNGSYVSNPDNVLTQETVTRIDTLLTSLETGTSVQVAVVAVKSIGDEDIFTFSQELFDRWGIGRKGNDNGLLMLLVTDSHTIRFHTGNGVEGVLPDVVCKQIQREFMLPRFKEGDYNAGMMAGLAEVARILKNPGNLEELKAKDDSITDSVALWLGLGVGGYGLFVVISLIMSFFGSSIKAPAASLQDYPEMEMSWGRWSLIYVVFPVVGLVLLAFTFAEDFVLYGLLFLYAYYACTRIYRLARTQSVVNRLLKAQDYSTITEFLALQKWKWLGAAVLFPIPFAFYFIYHLRRGKAYRNHPRNCKQCSGEMQKLDDVAEDIHLSKTMLLEESIKSVDYDVWKCKACQSIEVFFFLNARSKYEVCPKCEVIAYHLSGTRAVSAATYSSSGTEERTHQCVSCQFKKTSRHTIPKLEHSSSSSGGSSSSGSSSSGGSWGGGRSGGGGASSSW
jgi:uncharacterized protein